jgi:hypothetical protein
MLVSVSSREGGLYKQGGWYLKMYLTKKVIEELGISV